MNVLVVNFKKSIFSILIICFIISLLIFSNTNIKAAQEGLTLWATSVVPSLFPFFIGVELLYCTNLVNILGKYCKNFMKTFFNLSGEAVFPIIMGTISGYPTGAKIVSNLRMDKKISKTEGEHLLAFTNNSGPLFIIGTVGILMFGNSSIGLLLFVTHIIACITVGIIFRFWKSDDSYLKNISKTKYSASKGNVDFSNLGEILAQSITSSTSTILLIGGFVVIFSSIISILKASGLLNSLGLIFTPIANFINIDIIDSKRKII